MGFCIFIDQDENFRIGVRGQGNIQGLKCLIIKMYGIARSGNRIHEINL
jgi:hypothetical protein